METCQQKYEPNSFLSRRFDDSIICFQYALVYLDPAANIIIIDVPTTFEPDIYNNHLKRKIIYFEMIQFRDKFNILWMLLRVENKRFIIICLVTQH